VQDGTDAKIILRLTYDIKNVSSSRNQPRDLWVAPFEKHLTVDLTMLYRFGSSFLIMRIKSICCRASKARMEKNLKRQLLNGSEENTR
jgi:hypothetical protein